MDEETLARLRRLGVVKGARQLGRPRPLNSPPPAGDEPPTYIRPGNNTPSDPAGDDPPQPLPALLPGGQMVDTPLGQCFILDTVYPLAHRHGQDRLEDLLQYTPAGAVPLTGDPRLAGLDFRDFLFLDTETTGLGGAGALAFMVGTAFFEGDALVVRQYFLPDPADEPALLHLLEALLAGRAGLITFNGRAFDLPLLDNRYLMNRSFTDLLARPHIDLLPPARRIWRNRLTSCALGSLEERMLGVQRTQADVPGWLIPSLYNRYLADGDARELVRVFYHNEIDMLSMVTLLARVMRQFHHPDPSDHPLDLLGVGKWQADLGLLADAEQNLRRAAVPAMPTDYYQQALHQLGQLLKRAGRWEEAVQVWQQMASTSFEDISAHVALAKYYEWQAQALAPAMVWTNQALQLVAFWPDPGRAALARQELQHRLDRLARKIATQ